MRKFGFTNEVNKIINEDKIKEVIVDGFEEGLLICASKDKAVIFMNDVAETKIFFDCMGECNFLTDLFTDREIKDIINEKNICIEIRHSKVDVIGKVIGDYIIVFLRSGKHERKELQTAKELNVHLQEIYETYNDDTISITDENGIVEFCGEASERHCGISARDIIGKNMFDLEREKYFYPSATVAVLKSGKSEVVKQDTKTGLTLITVGVPVYENGKIKKVIAISRDFSKEIKMATLLIDAKYGDKGIEGVNNSKGKIVTCSRKIYSLLTLMQTIADKNSTVLLMGETGTGKGLFAEYLHTQGKRVNGPFIKVNCGALPEGVMESELYGYEGGTFTGADEKGRKGLFELANGGTIFLDEIAEMPMRQQVKLLHLLQDRTIRKVGGNREIPIDVRIICATNKNLEMQIEKNLFREDLYYRLNVVSINIPPLRERKEDIPLLIRHFLNKNNDGEIIEKEISSDAIKLLCEYNWPGNIRELEHMIEMLSVTAEKHIIEVDDLPDKVLGYREKESTPIYVREIMPLNRAVELAEENLIKMALEKSTSQQEMADMLRVDRSTVSRKMRQYNIERSK